MTWRRGDAAVTVSGLQTDGTSMKSVERRNSTASWLTSSQMRVRVEATPALPSHGSSWSLARVIVLGGKPLLMFLASSLATNHAGDFELNIAGMVVVRRVAGGGGAVTVIHAAESVADTMTWSSGLVRPIRMASPWATTLEMSMPSSSKRAVCTAPIKPDGPSSAAPPVTLRNTSGRAWPKMSCGRRLVGLGAVEEEEGSAAADEGVRAARALPFPSWRC